MTNTLIEGDPLAPDSSDIIAQQTTAPYGVVPPGEGWRIMSGNVNFNSWARVVYRYEIENEQ